MENNTIQKLVDIAGLSKYHEKLKGVLETKQDVIEDLDSIRSKANSAAGAADQALTDAKAYVDGKVDGKFDAAGSAADAQAAAEAYADSLVKDSEGKSLFDAAGTAAQALADAKADAAELYQVKGNYEDAGAAAAALDEAKTYVDDKVDGKFDAAGSAAQALADAKADAAEKYQVKGDYDAAGTAAQALADAKTYVDGKVDGKFDAAGTAAGLNTAMDARVAKLEAIDHEKLASDASAAAVAAIVAGAESDFDTLKDVADWIGSHKEGAAELQTTVSEHTESITALETDKQDVIEDLATIRSGAAAGATALQSVPEEYVTETELASKGYLTNDNFGFATDADIDNLFA